MTAPAPTPTDDLDALLAAAAAASPSTSPDLLAAVAVCMATTRSIRRFRPDPVDPALLQLVLKLATTAGSGANMQPWRFIVVTDPLRRGALGDWYRRAWEEYGRRGMTTLPEGASPARQRSMAAAEHLAAHFEEAPVVVVPCLKSNDRIPVNLFIGASIFPAVQNLVLAARAVGLGTTLTCMQGLSGVGFGGESLENPDYLDGLRDLLAVPPTAVPVAVMPLGWPDEPFGLTGRRPVEAVTYAEHWGTAWEPGP